MAGREPGLAVVLGLALFAATAAGQFSPGEAAPASLPLAVGETEAAPAALLQVGVVKEVAVWPASLFLLLAEAGPADSLSLLVGVKPAGMRPLLAEVEAEAAPAPLLMIVGVVKEVAVWPASLFLLLAEVGPADSLSLLVGVKPAGMRPLLAEVEAEAAPAPLLVLGVIVVAVMGLPRTIRRRPQPGPGSRPPHTGDQRRGSPPCHARTPHRHHTWGPLQPSIVPAQPPSPGVQTDWGPGTTTSCTAATVAVAASPCPFLFFLPPFLFFLPSFFSPHKNEKKKKKPAVPLLA
ncbi:UNVERIFIED_CONTAM: hypothetical protein FKN15_010878 [Acipenser sinensis]